MSIASPHLPTRGPLGLVRRSSRATRPVSSRRISATRIAPTGQFLRRNDHHDSERNSSLVDVTLRQVRGVHSLHR